MDNLDEWIEALKTSKKCILVEGKKDRQALAQLGITKVVLVAGKPVYKVIESVQEKEIIILTDLDKEGKRLYAKLKRAAQRRKIKVDQQFREFLCKETALSHIEGLDTYYRNTS